MEVRSNQSCQVLMEANGPRSSGCTTKDPKSVHRVAQEFESLLISQLLKSMKQGALGEEGGGANDSVMQYAQESMARVLSQNGGIGMASVIERALTPQSPEAQNSAAPSSAESLVVSNQASFRLGR
jgi:Rod binding domain-containing protein